MSQKRHSNTETDVVNARFPNLSALGDAKGKRAREIIDSLAKFPQENPFPVLRLDAEGNILYCNVAGRVVIGQWSRRVGETAPAEWCDLVRKALQVGHYLTQDIVCGEQIFSMAVAPVAEGNYVNLYGVDITQQKKYEALLLKSRDELEVQVQQRTSDMNKTVISLQQEMQERRTAEQALRDASRHLDAFFTNTITPLVMLDREFNFIRVNKAYADACHRSIEEFTGHNHFEFYPNEENQQIFVDVVRTKTPYSAVAKPFSFPDHPEWGVTYWDWSLTPILGDDGEVDLLVFSLKDVTAGKKAELELLAGQEKLRLLSIRLQSTEERERRRLAQDLHDSIGQLLAFSSRELKRLHQISPEFLAESLHEIGVQLDQAVQQTRTLSFNLSPGILYDLGLETALEELLEQFERNYKFSCCLTVCPAPKPLAESTRVFLYRAVRELLTNAAKHAEPRHIDVSLTREGDDLQVIVADDGCGFQVSPESDTLMTSHGFGLFGLRERLDALGGRLELDTAPGRGARVTLTVPLDVQPPKS